MKEFGSRSREMIRLTIRNVFAVCWGALTSLDPARLTGLRRNVDHRLWSYVNVVGLDVPSSQDGLEQFGRDRHGEVLVDGSEIGSHICALFDAELDSIACAFEKS